MVEAIQRTGWDFLWEEDRYRRLRSRFVIGSILLHLVLALLLYKGLPEWLNASRQPDASPPLTVTLLDPDVVKELPIGPTTHLPPKPKNLEAAPLGRLAPAPMVNPTIVKPQIVKPMTPLSRAETAAPGRDAGHETAALGDPALTLPPMAGHEPAKGSTADSLPVPPAAGSSIPGLPFVSREELQQEIAKLYSDQPKSKAPYEVNTEDLQYLSYISQIARMLELIWKYPREAGDRGQQGQTVLKITILNDGTLEATELVQSSGYALLDNEALRVVKRLAPYQPLPKSWHRSEWDLTISFTYVLNGVAVNVI